MFCGFKISEEEVRKLLREDYIRDKQFLNESSQTLQEKFQELDHLCRRELDATQLEDEWFPHVNADIFLSHSHADEYLVKDFAKMLYGTYRLRTFVDSLYWKYSNDLLKLLDHIYSIDEEDGKLKYEKCVTSSSHVNMLLSCALQKMIDKTECFIFLESGNSLRSRSMGESMRTTYSPWIYQELLSSEMLRRKSKEEHRKRYRYAILNEEYELKISYPAPVGNLNELYAKNFQDIPSSATKYNALDYLYASARVIERN